MNANEPIDRRLGDFFKAEVPQPWPAAPATDVVVTSSNHVRTKSSNLSRSRLALAASLAFMLVGVWAISMNSSNGKQRSGLSIDDGAADSKFLKEMGKEPKKR
jgi:hypothetical protein